MYVGVEGSSYVGKTTAVQKLASRNFEVIPEYDKFGPFPNSDGSIKGLKNVIDQLLEREVSRSKMVTPTATTFSDRTPVSLITFEAMQAVHAKNTEDRELHETLRDYALSRTKLLAAANVIQLPDAIAVLRLHSESEFMHRVASRGITAVGELALYSTQLYIAEQAAEYSSVLVGDNAVTMIDVDAISADEVADRLVDFSRSAI